MQTTTERSLSTAAITATTTYGEAANRRVRWWWLSTAIGLFVLLGLLSYVATLQPYFAFDPPVARWIQSVNWGPLAWAFPLITSMTGDLGNIVAAGVLLIALVVNRGAAAFSLLIGIGSALTYVVLNLVVQQPRPTPDLVRVVEHAAWFGWPSGHAEFATTQIALLVLCVAGALLPRRWLYPIGAIGVAAILSFCIERVYIGAHWPSQTIGGILATAAWLALAFSMDRVRRPVVERISSRR